VSSTFCYGAHVRANGIRQHYLRYGGSGDSIILVPGITSPAITWGFVAERLGRSFDVYVMDVRGRGLSEAGDSLDYRLDACAADITTFAQALRLRNPILVGHSMGARIGIRAARLDSGVFGRLVLIDPPVTGPGRRPYPVPLAWYIESIRAMKEGESYEVLRRFTPTWDEEHLRLRAEWLHTCDEKAVEQTHLGFHEDEIVSELAYLRVPTLLMVAGKGGTILPEDVDEMKGFLPSISVTHVPNAGHMIPWDDFSGFFEAFGDFLGVRP
jgi:N-formylmaleamate deformylase